jgi:hypothetical protein
MVFKANLQHLVQKIHFQEFSRPASQYIDYRTCMLHKNSKAVGNFAKIQSFISANILGKGIQQQTENFYDPNFKMK